ncbi:MAG: family 43 glycosylhydrolase, partial [Bacteroidota bacterium]
LYKIDGKYLLMVAEGGTGFHHAVTAHISDSLWGPYVPLHSNPVMSHRQLGSDYPIHSVGHADLIQTPAGDWWAVMLAKRKIDGYSLLARESFLTPVQIETQEDWPTPVFNPGEGKLLMQQARPDLPWHPWPSVPQRDEFDKPTPSLAWNCLRSPQTEWYSLSDGMLQLQVRPEMLDSLGNPSYLAQRIEHHQFSAGTKMKFAPKPNEQAGLVLYRNSTHHLGILLEKGELIVYETEGGKKTILVQKPWKKKSVVLKAQSDGLKLQFWAGEKEDKLQMIGPEADLSILADEKAGGFSGPYVGVYASSQGAASQNVARFDWFEYQANK